MGTHAMTDIVTFLTAQYDAEEKRLRDGWYGDVHWKALDNAAALGGWTAARQLGISVKDCDQITSAALALIRERLEGWQQQEAEVHLADVVAKRRIVELHTTGVIRTYQCSNREHIQEWQCERAGEPYTESRYCEVCGNDCQELPLLAASYADRPGDDELPR